MINIFHFNMNICFNFMFTVSRYSYITFYTNIIISGICFVLQDFHIILQMKIFIYEYILTNNIF